MMDFGALPPEINSGRMYSGDGSQSMMSAASAWDSLAAELHSVAAAFTSTVSGLAGHRWQGSASVSMTAAAAAHVGWVNTVAAQAEQTAGAARTAAAAFESAFAATVAPPVIAANRAQLASLVATNLLGQNAPAIAATEAHYAEMWAQDTAAMYGYAGDSALATRLSAFTAAPQATNPSAAASQAAATAQTASTSTQVALTQLISAVPTTLQTLASPAASATAGTSSAASSISASASSASSGLLSLLAGNSTSTTGWAGMFNDIFSSNGLGLNSNLWNTVFSSGFYMPGNFAAGDLLALVGMAADSGGAEALNAAGQAASGGLGGVLTLPAGGLGSLGSAIAPGAGKAATIGPLSVPPAWTPVIPPTLGATLGNVPLTAPGAGALAAPGAQGPPAFVPPMALGRGGPTIVLPDNRFLARPAMIPSWSV